jgi:hypothetical protein
VDDWTGPFCREGWITRDGKFLPCDREWLHGHVAWLALGGEDAEFRAERMGWLRISTYGESCSKPLSQKQRDTFWDWAEAMGFDYADIVATLEGFPDANVKPGVRHKPNTSHIVTGHWND